MLNLKRKEKIEKRKLLSAVERGGGNSTQPKDFSNNFSLSQSINNLLINHFSIVLYKRMDGLGQSK